MKFCPLLPSLLWLIFPLVWCLNETEEEINLRANREKHINGDRLWSTKLSPTLTLVASIHLKSLWVSTSKFFMVEGHSTAVVWTVQKGCLILENHVFFPWWLQATKRLQETGRRGDGSSKQRSSKASVWSGFIGMFRWRFMEAHWTFWLKRLLKSYTNYCTYSVGIGRNVSYW